MDVGTNFANLQSTGSVLNRSVGGTVKVSLTQTRLSRRFPVSWLIPLFLTPFLLPKVSGQGHKESLVRGYFRI